MLYQRDETATPQDNFLLGRQELYFTCFLNKSVAAVYDYSNTAKEVYGIITGLPWNAYLKFGTFQLAYGLMLADDNSYIRAPFGFSFGRSDTGIETGFYPDPFFLKLAVFNGAGSDDGKILSSWGGINISPFTIGGSFYNEDSSVNGDVQKSGVFGWGRFWRIVGLGEYDRGYTQNPATGSWDRAIAIHGSLEADLGNSVYLRLTREFRNPSYAVGDESVRNVVGIVFYPVQFLQVLPQYTLIQPVSGPNQNSFNVDIHEFF